MRSFIFFLKYFADVFNVFAYFFFFKNKNTINGKNTN